MPEAQHVDDIAARLERAVRNRPRAAVDSQSAATSTDMVRLRDEIVALRAEQAALRVEVAERRGAAAVTLKWLGRLGIAGLGYVIHLLQGA